MSWNMLAATASRSLLRAAAPRHVVRAAAVPTAQAPRTVTTLAKSLYTAKGQASGQGRNGKAALTEEGPFEVKLAMPKSLGGTGDGQNPEQLFALGYSSCFLSALNLVAKQEGIKLPSDVKCDAHVSIGPPSSGSSPFAIAVDLTISSSGSGEQDNQSLQKAVDQAHKVCPYSNATRNNVPVSITIE